MEEMNLSTEMNNQPEEIHHVDSSPMPEEIASQQQFISNEERNFASLREKAERVERERDEAIRYIQQMQMQHHNQNTSDDDNDIAPDDLTERRYVDKKIKRLESQIQQYETYTQSNLAEARIKSQFNDFDQIVTPQAIEILKNTYPEIAQSLHATPDLYNKAVSTYNIIKKFGLSKPYNAQSEYEKSLAQKNTLKPRATNTISPQQGETPLNKANEFANGFLTPERKSQLYKEMMEARNNY